MDDNELKVIFAPTFTESIKTIPEEERDEVWEEIQDVLKGLQTNPYLGTPINAGRCAIFLNYIKRTVRKLVLWLKS